LEYYKWEYSNKQKLEAILEICTAIKDKGVYKGSNLPIKEL
jgi:hypothetical protein